MGLDQRGKQVTDKYSINETKLGPTIELQGVHIPSTVLLSVLEQYLERIAELEQQGEWISVDTAMPDEDGLYWTYNALEDYVPQKCYIYNKRNNKFNSHTVTHWKPLPSPPKD